MKKKIIILVLIAFLLTGCTVNYNLDISKDLKYKEEILIDSDVSPLSENQFLANYKQPVAPKSIEIYDLTTKINEENQLTRYYYEHNQKDYINNTFINRCYPEAKLTQEDGSLILKTSGSFQCMHMYLNLNIDEMKINITPELRVQDSNADKVDGNKYTWNLNEDNYLEKTIYLKMKLPITTAIVNNTTKNTFLLVGAIAILVFLIFAFVKLKKHKNNNL